VYDEYGLLTSDLYDHEVWTAGVYDMVPTPGVAHTVQCSRCPLDIEPLEPHYRSRDGLTVWCDACMVDEESLM
jgi:hypothetical protein